MKLYEVYSQRAVRVNLPAPITAVSFEFLIHSPYGVKWQSIGRSARRVVWLSVSAISVRIKGTPTLNGYDTELIGKHCLGRPKKRHREKAPKFEPPEDHAGKSKTPLIDRHTSESLDV